MKRCMFGIGLGTAVFLGGASVWAGVPSAAASAAVTAPAARPSQQAVNQPLSALNREIESVRSSLSACEKSNPHVYFNDSDNPTMNIRKGVRETRINKTFYCPYHRGFVYEGGVCGWQVQRRNDWRVPPAGCPALSNNINGYPVWNALLGQVAQTELKDREEKVLRERLAALQSRRSALALARDMADRAPADPNTAVEEPVVISLPRTKMFELYANKVVYYNGYKIQVK